jgi:succinate dehydrogenase/fumarate reductase cytochrome b subunit
VNTSPFIVVVVLLAGLAAALWLLERRKPTGLETAEASTTGARLFIVGLVLGVAAAIAVSIVLGEPL